MDSSDAAHYTLLDTTSSRSNTRLVDNDQGLVYDIRAADGAQQQRIVRFYKNLQPVAAVTYRLHASMLIKFDSWDEPKTVDEFMPRASIYRG